MAGIGRLPRKDQLERTVGRDERYRLLRLINQDALGSLWEAEDTDLRCPVAVRVLSAVGDRQRQRELRARLGAVHERLDHPRVAYVYGYSERDAPEQYVVMEPISGETLDHRLQRSGPLHPADALAIAAEIADGLQAAHDARLAHGGLSAESVVLQGDGSIKLIDFGVAPAASSGDPPEQVLAGDVAQLRALLREMTGSRGGEVPAGSSARDLATEMRKAAEVAEARRVEEVRKAQEAAREAERAARERERRHAEAARKTEDAQRLTDEARRAEEEARAEHARLADAARRAEEAGAEEESRRREAAHRTEEASKRAQDARNAEAEARAEHARLADAARRAEEAGAEEESRRREAARVAEDASKRAEDARAAEEEARAEHARRMDDLRRAEEALRGARSLLTELEEEAGDGTPPDEPHGGGTEPAVHAPPPSVTGAAKPKSPAASGLSGGGVLLGPSRAPGPGPGGGAGPAPRSPGVAGRRGPGGPWLLGGITVLVVAVAGWMMAAGLGDQAPPRTARSAEQPPAADVIVPDLRGMTAADAQLRLSEEGLALEAIVPVTGTPGLVQDSGPAPGEAVTPGSTVTLFIGVEPDRLEEEIPSTP